MKLNFFTKIKLHSAVSYENKQVMEKNLLKQ